VSIETLYGLLVKGMFGESKKMVENIIFIVLAEC